MLVSPPSLETPQHLDLGSRRSLEYRTFGAASGPLVVVLDGPASRGLARAAAPAAEEAGLRLVAPDRPQEPGFSAWAADHAALLDALGAERAGVLGQSGGTPYALAAAAALPERTIAVALLGALAPGLAGVSKRVAGGVRLARRAPWLLRVVLWAQNPQKTAAKAVARLPPVDVKIMEDPRLVALNLEATTEILSRPADVAHELGLVGGDWDIDFVAINAPVALWSGDADAAHPTPLSRQLAALLGDAPVHVVHDAATFGLMPHYGEALRFAAGQGAA